MKQYFKLEEIETVAERFLSDVGGRRVFAFHGVLGAGKTTFISVLCRMMGVTDTPSSPTFSLINDYIISDEKERHVYHLDMYRMKDEEEAIQAGIEDYLLSGLVCFVEWPENIPDLLPEDTLHVYIEPEGDGRMLEW